MIFNTNHTAQIRSIRRLCVCIHIYFSIIGRRKGRVNHPAHLSFVLHESIMNYVYLPFKPFVLQCYCTVLKVLCQILQRRYFILKKQNKATVS